VADAEQVEGVALDGGWGEPGLHVPGDVVRQHPQEHVRADAFFGAVADRADVQVGVEGAGHRASWHHRGMPISSPAVFSPIRGRFGTRAPEESAARTWDFVAEAPAHDTVRW
jgi:hypothetical protein